MSCIQTSNHVLSHCSDQRAGDLLLARDDFQIRLAPVAIAPTDQGLVERRYASRGYRCDGTTPRGAVVTLQACEGQKILGTLTLQYDSPEGLAADALYKPEIAAYRSAGGVCELTRLAIDPEFGSKELLGALFHMAYFFAGPVGGTRHVIIEVNPRHVGFYRRTLGFHAAGDCKICPRVDAPAVLLHLEVAHAAAQIGSYAGQGGSARTRSLYSYFCSPRECEELANRWALLAGGKGDQHEAEGWRRVRSKLEGVTGKGNASPYGGGRANRWQNKKTVAASV